MKLQFLGVGSGLSFKLGNTNAVINESILIDCGGSAPGSFMEIGNLNTITDIFITHLHGDHCHGLEILGFMNYFVYKKRTNLWITEEMENELWNEVLKGTMKKIQSADGSPQIATLSDFFTVCRPEDQGFEVTIDDVVINYIRTEHVPDKESYSFEITDGNSQPLMFTSDVKRPITDFVDDAEKYRLIFHDCQLYETGSDIHVSISALRKFPESLRKKIVLMHFGEGIEKEDTSMFHGYAEKFQVYE